MKIEQVLKGIDYNVGEISNFLWKSLGKSKIWDIKNIQGKVIGSFIANKEGEVLEVDFDFTYGEKDIFYRWIAPEFESAYLSEYSRKAKNINKFVDLENEDDCLEKLNAVVNIEDFDTRVVVTIDVEDEDFLSIAKMAHKANITFNDQVNIILQKLVDAYGVPKSGIPYFGEMGHKNVTHIAKPLESIPVITRTLEVQEGDNGDVFIEFPPDIMNLLGWKEGDIIDWQDQGDKSFILKKM